MFGVFAIGNDLLVKPRLVFWKAGGGNAIGFGFVWRNGARAAGLGTRTRLKCVSNIPAQASHSFFTDVKLNDVNPTHSVASPCTSLTRRLPHFRELDRILAMDQRLAYEELGRMLFSLPKDKPGKIG